MSSTYQHKTLFVLAFAAVTIVSCKPQTAVENNEGKVAQVGNTILYKQDLDNIIPGQTSSQDSIVHANAYIEKWIREQILVGEAEANVSDDAGIDKLVNDYRSSLLKHKYENLIIKQNLDTVISATELKSNYLANKSQYVLTEPIVQCLALSIPSNSNRLEAVRKAWKEEQFDKIQSLVMNIAGAAYHTKENGWIKRRELYNIIPYSAIKDESLEKNTTLDLKDGSNKCFLKIFDYVDKNQEPPLDYISLQLKKVILHKRKQKILKEKLENTYESELRKNNIKVY